MMVRVVALAGAALLYAGSALADDPMSNTYANTVNTKNTSNGQTGMLYFNQDMTYTAKATGPNGQPISYSGTWTLKDDNKTICLTPIVPAGTPNPPPASCSPLSTHNVGDSWTVTNDQNQTFEVSITAGR